MALVTHQRSLMRSLSKTEPGRSVLVVSPDRQLRSRVSASLQSARWHVREVSGGAEALGEVERERPDAVAVATWLPDLRCEELTTILAQSHPHVEIVSLEGETLNRGTRNDLRQELTLMLRESSEAGKRTSAPGTRSTASGQKNHTPLGSLIGASEPMLLMQEQIRLVAAFPTTVLIEGETGSGKELVANAIHTSSPRAQAPFVVLNCAAIPEALLEAELFGHTRGAFTGAVQARLGRIEAADGGTIFLDEIGEMPLALQAKMLRFLENGELQRVGENTPSHVDVRVVAATHRRLEQMSEEGLFRLDLYHRLAVFPIEVPALRERLEDIVPLTEHFLDLLAERSFRKQLSPDALELLLAHSWPGNVRELMHVLERGVILSADLPVVGGSHIRIRRRARS